MNISAHLIRSITNKTLTSSENPYIARLDENVIITAKKQTVLIDFLILLNKSIVFFY
jgi:hypothetical protein